MSARPIGADLTGERLLALRAQASRLATAAQVLFGEPAAEPTDDPAGDVIALLHALCTRLTESRDDAELWLVLTAMAGGMPGERDVEHAVVARDTKTAGAFLDWFIPASSVPGVWGGDPFSTMRVVSDRPLVDVHICATTDRHTGIQRVERETLPHWIARHDIELVAWTTRDGGYRALDQPERDRVLEWSGPSRFVAEPAAHELVVPWRTRVLLPEVPDGRQSSRLIGLARFSGSTIAGIGYDLIPLTSPEFLPKDNGPDFLDYLGALKYATSIATISESAAEEFGGFFDAVAPQGTRARVATCALPVDVSALAADAGVSDAPAEPAPGTHGIPVVLCVGSHEPRKNHVAVLHAAETLWRQGVRFELWFFGGGGWGTYFEVRARELRRRGRPLTIQKAVSDEVLWGAFRRAAFTVFPSLHEGYGLPVAESLACGTPVITTRYGSTAEVAEGGGCLLIDPRDDAQLHDAMAVLLTDEQRLAELREAARARTFSRTWPDYADELWQVLMGEDA